MPRTAALWMCLLGMLLTYEGRAQGEPPASSPPSGASGAASAAAEVSAAAVPSLPTYPGYNLSTPGAWLPAVPGTVTTVSTTTAGDAAASVSGLPAATTAPEILGLSPSTVEIGRPLTVKARGLGEDVRLWLAGISIHPVRVDITQGELVVIPPKELTKILPAAGGAAQLVLEVGSQRSAAISAEVRSPDRRQVAPREAYGIAAVLVLGFLLVTGYMARRALRSSSSMAQTARVLQALLIDPDSDTWSLSRVQMGLWSLVIAWSYLVLIIGNSAALAAMGGLPDVGDGVPALLGLSLGTTIASSAIGNSPRSKKPRNSASRPHMRDLVCVGDTPSLMRLQLLLWTLIALGSYVTLFLSRDPASLSLPELPSNLLLLTGFSQGSYLADKYVAAPPQAPATEAAGSGADLPDPKA